jgi:hypothetical protein
VRPGLALERREAVADLDEPEGQRLRDQRLRELAVNDSLQDLLPDSPAMSGGDASP